MIKTTAKTINATAATEATTIAMDLIGIIGVGATSNNLICFSS